MKFDYGHSSNMSELYCPDTGDCYCTSVSAVLHVVVAEAMKDAAKVVLANY